MRFLALGLLFLALLAGPAHASCQGEVDQVNDYIPPGSPSTNSSPQCQTFVPTLPFLAAVEVRYRVCAESPPVGNWYTINILEGGVTGPVIGTSYLFIPGPLEGCESGWHLFEFDPCIELSPDQTYAIQAWDFPSYDVASWHYSHDDEYPAGGWSSDCLEPLHEEVDLHFITHGAAIGVPALAPWGVAMLAGVLLGLSRRFARARP